MPVVPTVSSYATLYTQSQRAALGATWPDGIVGVLPTTGGAYLGLGADPLGTGYVTSLMTVGSHPAIGSQSAADKTISGLPGIYNYAGGGPMFRMSDNSIVRVIHTERWDHTTFWASLNLVRSTDEGATWTYLGVILQPGESYATFLGSSNLHGGTDIGGGPIVLAGGYYYVWFMEFAPSYATSATWGTDLYISVARCDRPNFDAAVLSGSVPSFKKWDGAGWTQDGLTGQGAVVNVNSRIVSWLDVFFLPWCNCFVMVAAQVTPTRAVVCGTSRDGINWSPAQIVAPSTEFVSPYVPTYTSIIPPKFGTISRQAAGKSFTVMYNHVNASNTWGDTDLRTHVLTFNTGSRRTRGSRYLGGPNAAYMR